MSAQLATPSARMSTDATVDGLWLGTLHELCARVAHELKGAMNGVSVNLEVVRSRAEKPDVKAASLTTYTSAAAAQFDVVIELSAALLRLARAPRVPVELGATVRDVAMLLQRAAKADGRRLDVEGSFEGLGVTSADGNAARLAIGASFLTAIESSSHVEARPGANATLRIVSCDGVVLASPPRLVIDALADAGIRIAAEASAISISFP